MSHSHSTISPADAAAAGILPRKTFECEFKSLDEAAGTFSLYAAVFGNVDRQGDIIEPGAFDNLDEFVTEGWIALNHRQLDLPVGYPTKATQDAHGLYIEGRFHTTMEAQECRKVIKERKEAGKKIKCSIGYLCRDEAFEKQDGTMIRRIKKASVYEGSFVNLAANNSAEVVDAKSAHVPTPTPSPEGQTMPDKITPAGAEIVTALKDFLTAVKGEAMPKSGHTRLKAFAEQMHEHGSTTKEHAKAMREHGAAACEMAKAMKSFLKEYGAEGQDVDEYDDNEPDEEGRREEREDGGKGKSSRVDRAHG